MKNNNYYKVTQLDTDLWAIEDIKSSENSISYLICGQNKALVFDTGLGLSPVLPVIRGITQLPIVVCLSHWHFDHVGGAYAFDDLVGWKSDRLNSASQHGVSMKTIQSQVGPEFWDSLGFYTLKTKSFPQIQLINQEQSIDLGNYRLNILHTPGHTEDSICLYESNHKWLFSGDTVYPGPIYLQFDDSNFQDYKNSIGVLEKLEISSIFPGHNSLIVREGILNDLKLMLQDVNYKSIEYPSLKLVF